MNLRERLLGGLWGAVVGDALGVPVEFQERGTLQRKPVVGMRGYGTHHQPPGTWSDDSSLMLCTVASLTERNGLDFDDLSKRFVAWLYEGYMTPRGKVFDVGNATRSAIGRLQDGTPPTLAGGSDEGSNGNGSLMRILPIALFQPPSFKELLYAAHRASALTHRHPRSQIACGIYCLIATDLMSGKSPLEAYHRAIEFASTYYKDHTEFAAELKHFERFLSGQIPKLPEDKISSGTYVIQTLEASVWCLTITDTFQDAVLRAVNLGEDTDTTGTITGGLAGLWYGIENNPIEWRTAVARSRDLERLFDEFVEKTVTTAII